MHFTNSRMVDVMLPILTLELVSIQAFQPEKSQNLK